MIGLVVINFGNPVRTIRFVREECSKIKTEHCVVVVDNGSTEGSLSSLEEGLEGLADIIPSTENLGFARGNNLGAGHAIKEHKADILLFVNNDIVFTDPDVAGQLASVLASHPEVGMVGPKVVGMDGKCQSPEPFRTFAQAHLLPYWGKLIYGRRKLSEKMQKSYSDTAREGCHYRIMGSIMMMRASDFTACGGMDPHTFLYAEEAILSERLKRLGKAVWYDPSVQVLHEHGATISEHYDIVRRRRMRLESDAYYYRTYLHLPCLQYWLARFTYALKAFFGR